MRSRPQNRERPFSNTVLRRTSESVNAKCTTASDRLLRFGSCLSGARAPRETANEEFNRPVQLANFYHKSVDFG